MEATGPDEIELAEPDAPSKVRTVAAALAVIVLAITATAGAMNRDRPSALSQARDLLNDDDNFVTATETGITFVRVSRFVRDEAERCAADDGLTDDRCEALFSASAYAQIDAVQVLECTRPGVFTARETMQTYLAQLAQRRTPDPPPPTRC